MARALRPVSVVPRRVPLLTLLALGCDGPARNAPDVPQPTPDVIADVTTDVCAPPRCGCVPEARVCSDDARAVERCAADGATRAVVERCTAGTLCAEGRCVSPCAWAAEARGHEGCEFWAVGTLNSGLGRYDTGASRAQFPFAVVLANPWPVEATATLEGGGLAAPRTETVPPRGVRTVTLPWVRALGEGGDPDAATSARVPGGAVRVRVSLPVAAYQFNPLGFASTEGCDEARCRSFTNDASLLLPVAALRGRYTVVTRPTVRVLQRGETRWQRSPGFVTVVATADATEVTLRLRARTSAGVGVPAGAPGATLRATLARGEAWQVLSDAPAACARPEVDTVRGDTFCAPVPEEDLTGSVVEASAPVAVFAGHDCALVPYDRFACDHLEEQLLPDDALGGRYVVGRTPPVADEPDLLRVVATRPATRVTFEPARAHAPVTLGEGEHVEFEQRESVAVTASAPVAVAQFLVGAGWDRESPVNVRGDPDMVLAPPVEQVRGRYRFVAAPAFPDSVAVVTTPEGTGLVLDGREVSSAPSGRVAGWDVFHLRIAPGAHSLEGTRAGQRFGLVVTGVAPSTSYTYPAGLDLAPIAPPR